MANIIKFGGGAKAMAYRTYYGQNGTGGASIEIEVPSTRSLVVYSGKVSGTNSYTYTVRLYGKVNSSDGWSQLTASTTDGGGRGGGIAGTISGYRYYLCQCDSSRSSTQTCALSLAQVK